MARTRLACVPPAAGLLPVWVLGEGTRLMVKAIGFGDRHLCPEPSAVLVTECPGMGAKPL